MLIKVLPAYRVSRVARVRKNIIPQPGKCEIPTEPAVKGRQGDKEKGRQGDKETRGQGDKGTRENCSLLILHLSLKKRGEPNVKSKM
jgi:hypothetical protein